jgi:hypothetical protein
LATDPVDRCAVNVGSILGRPRPLDIQARLAGRRVVGSAARDVTEPS